MGSLPPRNIDTQLNNVTSTWIRWPSYTNSMFHVLGKMDYTNHLNKWRRANDKIWEISEGDTKFLYVVKLVPP
jgi:hypothetical protein